jgi:beta-phosphoglucomutase-like phosphatase (HAD superfamily)
MLSEKFDLLLFDLDDTLINTSRAYTEAQQESLITHIPELKQSPAEWQVHRNQLQWFCKAFGSGNPELYFKAFLQSNGRNFQDVLVEKLVKTYDELFWSKLAPFPLAEAFLQQAMDAGKQIGLVSNGKTKNQYRKLQVTRLQSFFPEKTCWISEEFASNQKKPSPFMILEALKSFQVTPEKTLYIGNIISDILSGNSAGVQTVLYTDFVPSHQSVPQLAKPDYTLTQWDQPIVKYVG